MSLSKNKKNHPGMTLIEMLVAIGIFSLGMAGVTLLFSKVWKSNGYTLEMGQSTMAVSQDINKMMDYIRRASQSDNGSYPIVSAAANDLVLYSDYNKDGKVERLHLYKNGRNIFMGVTSSTSTMPKTYPAGDQQVISIANNIVNNSGTPIFYYYDHNYSSGSGQNPLAAPVTVSAVRLIKIYLEINIDPNRAPDNIKMQSFVELRNLSDNN